MANWIPVLILLPFVTGLVLMVFRSGTGRGGARWTALAGTVITLLASLGAAANYRSAVLEPMASASAAGVPANLDSPVNPPVQLRRPWLVMESPKFGNQPRRTLTMEFFLGVDGVSLALIVLTTVLCVSCVLISWEAIQEREAEFYACLMILEAGLIGVFCAFDLVLFYVFFEFTLIPLYFLVGVWGGPHRTFAAAKLFLYTLAGGLITLVGLAALIVNVWDRPELASPFSLPDLARSLMLEPLSLPVQIGLFLALSAGFFVKVPLFPFHTWLPLAHVEAPTAGSVLLAGVLLKLGAYGFLRLCLPLLPDACESWGAPLIAVLSVAGILYGSLCSLAQRDIKRLIAYSSVAHLGFCTLGLFALNVEGLTGGVLQMINHGLSTGALFLLVGMVYERYHTRMLDDLGGLARRLPLIACAMVFIAMASIGLPGLNGFVGEVLSLLGMFRRSPVYAVLGALGVVLGAWYLLTMLQHAFFGPLREPHLHGANGAHSGNGRPDAATLAAAALAEHAAKALPGGANGQSTPSHDGHPSAHASGNGHGDGLAPEEGHAHGHGHAPAPLHDNGIRDMNAREFLALAPLAALCLGIGSYPMPLINAMRPEIEALAAVYAPDGIAADAGQDAQAGSRARGQTGAAADAEPARSTASR